MRLSRRTLLGAPALLAPVLLPPRHAVAQPLWAGARATEAQRKRAIRRGLEFLHRTAQNQRHFRNHGADLLWCFFSTSRATAEDDVKRRAWTIGQERARRWRQLHPRLPANAGASELATCAYGSYAGDCLGVRDEQMKIDVQSAAGKFGPVDFLEFDPRKELAPAGVPEQCATCQSDNLRGQVKCRTCGRPLTMRDPYDLLCDALVAAYVWESYGISFGCSLADMMGVVSKMRPYDEPKTVSYGRFSSIAYAVTHVIYSLNDYSVYRLDPQWLPHEFAFLKDGLQRTIEDDDAELTGEFLDTLKSFGLTFADPVIRAGVEFVLSEQNSDGSWGDPDTGDIYDLYHPTWTAICGLMDYAWQGQGVRFPEALRVASGA